MNTRPGFMAGLAATIMLSGCVPEHPPALGARALGSPAEDAPELREDRTVYDRDNLAEMPIIRLTVTDLDGLARVHRDEPGADVAVLFQEGSFGAGLTEPNGRLSLRGRTGRTSTQKPYKVVLSSGAGRWKDQRRIHLLKNHYDLTRARNYLAFEYFKTIRHMTSLRHQLVHVYLNGEDLGLYEWIEHPGRRFLESHGLDGGGALYNVQLFAFRPYTDTLFDCTEDSGHCLEIEENHDPDKVRRMLDAVNDPSRDINEIIRAHFQRDNYETWLALQILFSNYSTASHNYLLYSPRGSETWYFLPWDYNGAFGYYGQPNRRDVPRSRTMVAPGYWWQVVLHRRYLSVPANVESLERRVRELAAGPVSNATTRRFLGSIRDRVRSFVGRAPDLNHLPVSARGMSPAEKMREWEDEWARVGGLVSRTARDFRETVEWPMGVWLGTPGRRAGDVVRFRWDASYDPQGDGITYDFRLARTPLFRRADGLIERFDLSEPTLELRGLRAGTYYYTVTIRDDDDPDEHWQIPFTKYHDRARDIIHYGVKEFTLP